MSGHFPNVPTECFSCPLNDCKPTSKFCTVRRQKKGLPPAKPEEIKSAWRPPVLGVAPTDYADKRDYFRQYNRNYRYSYRRVMLRGIGFKRADIALLRSIYETKTRTLEQFIVMLVEEMIENAKKKVK